MRSFLLLLALSSGLPATAQAETVSYSCRFSERCDSTGCGPASDLGYLFRLDRTALTGEMIVDGASYPGWVNYGPTLDHFFFVNDAGSELATFSPSGEVVYSGHMDNEGAISFYRLTGLCQSEGG
jgi:hypothetical protein